MLENHFYVIYLHLHMQWNSDSELYSVLWCSVYRGLCWAPCALYLCLQSVHGSTSIIYEQQKEQPISLYYYSPPLCVSSSVYFYSSFIGFLFSALSHIPSSKGKSQPVVTVCVCVGGGRFKQNMFKIVLRQIFRFDLQHLSVVLAPFVSLSQPSNIWSTHYTNSWFCALIVLTRISELCSQRCKLELKNSDQQCLELRQTVFTC